MGKPCKNQGTCLHWPFVLILEELHFWHLFTWICKMSRHGLVFHSSGQLLKDSLVSYELAQGLRLALEFSAPEHTLSKDPFPWSQHQGRIFSLIIAFHIWKSLPRKACQATSLLERHSTRYLIVAVFYISFTWFFKNLCCTPILF